MLSGIWGSGHATTTYGGNVGAIGMTKVSIDLSAFKVNLPPCTHLLQEIVKLTVCINIALWSLQKNMKK